MSAAHNAIVHLNKRGRLCVKIGSWDVCNEGEGGNEILVPENDSGETIVVHDDAGAVVKLGKKVLLEGNMVIGESCLITIEIITRLP